MKMFYQLWVYVVTLLIPTLLSAQSAITDFIPHTAGMVMTIDGGYMKSNMNMEKIRSLSVYKDLLTQVNAASMGQAGTFLESDKNIGLALDKRMYVFAEMKDDVMYFFLLAGVSDYNTLNNLGAMLPGATTLGNGTRAMIKDGVILAYNKDVVIVGGARKNPAMDEPMGSDETMSIEPPIAEEEATPATVPAEESIVVEEIMDTPAAEEIVVQDIMAAPGVEEDVRVNEAPEEISAYHEDEVEAERPNMNISDIELAAYVTGMLSQGTGNSISIGKEFQDTQKKQFDFGWFINNEQWQKMYYSPSMMGGLGTEAYKAIMDSPLGNMNKGVYSFATVTSKKGAIETETFGYYSAQALGTANKMLNKELNPKFLKYLKASSMLGMMSYAINMEEFANTMKAFGESTGKFKQSDLDEGLKTASVALGTTITEKDLYQLIGGDFLFAVTDVSEKEITYTDYDYDEDFNMKEVKRKKKTTIPTFVVMMGCQNESLMRTILDKAVSSSFVKKAGSNYSFTPPTETMNEIQIGINDGVLLLSNDLDLMKKRLKKGVKGKDKLLAARLAPEIMGSNVNVLFDIQKILGVVQQQMAKERTSDDNRADDIATILKEAQSRLGNAYMRTYRPSATESRVAKGVIEMTNKNNNAYDEIFDYIDYVYNKMVVKKRS